MKLQFWPGLPPALFPPLRLCRAPLSAPPARGRGHQCPPGRELGQGWHRALSVVVAGGVLTPGPVPLCTGFALGGESPLVGKGGRRTCPGFCPEHLLR